LEVYADAVFSACSMDILNASPHLELDVDVRACLQAIRSVGFVCEQVERAEYVIIVLVLEGII
jgi:hypothetical protein